MHLLPWPQHNPYASCTACFQPLQIQLVTSTSYPGSSPNLIKPELTPTWRLVKLVVESDNRLKEHIDMRVVEASKTLLKRQKYGKVDGNYGPWVPGNLFHNLVPRAFFALGTRLPFSVTTSQPQFFKSFVTSSKSRLPKK